MMRRRPRLTKAVYIEALPRFATGAQEHFGNILTAWANPLDFFILPSRADDICQYEICPAIFFTS